MTFEPTTIVTGQPTSIPIQCYLRGARDPATGNKVPAIFNSDDVLSAEVRPRRVTAPIFVPAIDWFTDMGTRTGWGQGMVLTTFTTEQSAMLEPGVLYTILVWRALATDMSNLELIARRPLLIKPLAFP